MKNIALIVFKTLFMIFSLKIFGQFKLTNFLKALIAHSVSGSKSSVTITIISMQLRMTI